LLGVDGIPIHQLFSLASLRFLIGIDPRLGAALQEALRIFGAVESGMWGVGVDFIA
jgi:hypothetical protein